MTSLYSNPNFIAPSIFHFSGKNYQDFAHFWRKKSRVREQKTHAILHQEHLLCTVEANVRFDGQRRIVCNDHCTRRAWAKNGIFSTSPTKKKQNELTHGALLPFIIHYSSPTILAHIMQQHSVLYGSSIISAFTTYELTAFRDSIVVAYVQERHHNRHYCRHVIP